MIQKLLIVISIIFISYSSAFGQVKSKKRMNSSYAKSRNILQQDIDSARYYLSIDYNKSFDFIEKGFKQLANNTQNQDKSITLNELLGDLYYKMEQYDFAREKYTLARQLSKTIPNSLKLKLIDANIKLKDFKTAENIINGINTTSIDNTTLLQLHTFKGDLFAFTNRLDEALSEYNKGLNLAKKVSDNSYTILFDNKIAEVYSKKGSMDKAEVHLCNSIKNAASEDVSSQIRQAETNAAFYRSNNEIEKEVSLRKENIEILEKLKTDSTFVKELQHQNLSIGEAFIKKQDYESAIPYLKNSIAKDKKNTDLDIEIQATKKLSEVYEKIGKSKLALANYRDYVDLMDEQYKTKEKEIKDAIKLTKNLANKQKRIEVLELDRELSVSKEQIYKKDRNIAILNTKKQNLIIYSLIGGLLLAIIAIFFFYKNNQQRKIANNLLALKALKSQMNPHFIFNALNSVNNFIAINDERKANKYLTDFSMLMRMVLDVSEKDFITLAEEVKLISLYTKLEHQRFEDKFNYTIDIDTDLNLDKITIPPMLIQPFIENAVWHGMRYKESKGNLSIIIKKKRKNVLISIIDDGVGRKKSQLLKSKNQLKKKSKGMNNISERIRILNEMYGYNIDVEISDLKSDNTGTKVELILPINNKNQTTS